MVNTSLKLSLAGVLAGYVCYLAGPLAYRTLMLWGFLSSPGSENDSLFVAATLTAIADTAYCEDIHYHAPSSTLFTACEDNDETRHKWFPPLTNFDDPELAQRSRGSIHVINPKTLRSRRLRFENFDGPFITHGIDVISDTDQLDGTVAVYVFAVNHVPAPDCRKAGQTPHARSQIEIFHHVLGSSTVRHVRSVWHPLIRTPNDIFASSATSFFMTNDHRYVDHGLMRAIEDLYARAKWTDVVHVQLNSLAAPGDDATAGVHATVAVSNIHNSNGLGHGRSPREILITSCSSGVLHIGQVSPDAVSGHDSNVTIVESIEVDAISDNPSYFSDPFSSGLADDRSGFVTAGVARPMEMTLNQRERTAKDPVKVVYVKPSLTAASGTGSRTRGEQRVLFADNGSRIRTASAAVLVAIDPATHGSARAGDGDGGAQGPRKAMLFVTGFQSKNIIAVEVDL
ncbi:hypothetical protein B0T26DRAFT_637893 [Lasiosphaeria miniovina]|uniref:Serum paraoxonase/arylesterase family protein n=1 Tax=Lasiosphaeria miniovina TaxID=1954250 RepID=A0AA40B4K1_9PEZI|nr:uncharacterized protein B0T26DRAFT_637893 [Lasiosphaeria miniovina]KAK0727515.1 hypothetical protein B0T26DRAFT_637893 [Lasiosphaeria miniovina]